jgi:hypothetical protein
LSIPLTLAGPIDGRYGLNHHHQPLQGGQFVLYSEAIAGNPYDEYTLAPAIEGTEKLSGRSIERAYVDKDKVSSCLNCISMPVTCIVAMT